MYRHLVNEIYHTVMYTLLPIDYVHDSQSATKTDFVYIENRQILYTTSYSLLKAGLLKNLSSQKPSRL